MIKALNYNTWPSKRDILHMKWDRGAIRSFCSRDGSQGLDHDWGRKIRSLIPKLIL
jgi:hypothetical protein